MRIERTDPGACPSDSICFNVVSAAPGAAGPADLVLAWTTLGDRPLSQHMLLQLRGDEQGIRIPRAAIPAPPASEDSAEYDTAYVVVLPRGEGERARLKASFGAAQMMFVHVPDPSQISDFARDRFVTDVAAGTAPYSLERRGMFDRFLLAPAGAVFELAVCPANQLDCDFPIPNPT